MLSHFPNTSGTSPQSWRVPSNTNPRKSIALSDLSTLIAFYPAFTEGIKNNFIFVKRARLHFIQTLLIYSVFFRLPVDPLCLTFFVECFLLPSQNLLVVFFHAHEIRQVSPLFEALASV